IILDEEMLDAKAPRYLAAVALAGGGTAGLAYLDVSTGEFRATELPLAALDDELARGDPPEILLDPVEAQGEGGALGAAARRRRPITAVKMPAAEAATAILGPLAAGVPPVPLVAAAAAVEYARATQPAGVLPLARLLVYRPEETLVLDDTSKTNLEIV